MDRHTRRRIVVIVAASAAVAGLAAALYCRAPGHFCIGGPTGAAAGANSGVALPASAASPTDPDQAGSAPHAANPGSNPSPESQCAQLRSSSTQLADRSSRQCDSDADCGCYANMTLDNAFATHRKEIAQKLGALSQAYRQLHCPTACMQTAEIPKCRATCRARSCQ